MLQIFTSEHKHWERVIGNINFALRTAPSATTCITPAMATFLKELQPLHFSANTIRSPVKRLKEQKTSFSTNL
uniref:Uncharacterized protein n=1 Tax=Strigamia maritima TaxID=126957 RepID=T1IRB3_STRMM